MHKDGLARGAGDRVHDWRSSQNGDLRYHEIEHTNGSVKGCRPLRGLDLFFDLDPGSNAPGFMLSPAPRAEREFEELLPFE